MSHPSSLRTNKFIVRFPKDLRDRLAEAATAKRVSMNSLFIIALERFLDQEQRQELLIEALAEKVDRLERTQASA